jgi:hypothetical protein
MIYDSTIKLIYRLIFLIRTKEYVYPLAIELKECRIKLMIRMILRIIPGEIKYKCGRKFPVAKCIPQNFL